MFIYSVLFSMIRLFSICSQCSYSQSLKVDETRCSYCKFFEDLRHGGGSRWNNLYRLCYFLRLGPNGCDSTWIKQVRRNSKAPQWYQHNLSVLAKASLRSEEKTRQGARSSRFSRWIEQGEILRQKLAVDWEQPMSLEKLSLVKPILCSMMFNVFSNIYFAFFC